MKLAYKYLKSYSVEPVTKWMKIKTKEMVRNKGCRARRKPLIPQGQDCE